MMSRHPDPLEPVPHQTAQVAHAAFPKGMPSLRLRDPCGTIVHDEDVADLSSPEGQPGLSPWRLALGTMRPLRDNLADRQAAEAVRARIAWQELVGLALTAPGCAHAVLGECRARQFSGNVEERWLDQLLASCRTLGWLKARGTHRPDAPPVLAAIRVLNRRERVGETLRAALHELAEEAPQWLRALAPAAWYERSRRRLADSRVPPRQAARDAYAQTVGEDGLCVVDAVEASEAPRGLGDVPSVGTRRHVWQEHDERLPAGGSSRPKGKARRVRFNTVHQRPTAAQKIASPYDPEARYRHQRATKWTGYLVHITETCEPDDIHLLPHVETTTAAVHEAPWSEPSDAALVAKGLAPGQPLGAAASRDAELLVTRRDKRGMELRGPARPNPSGQSRLAGAYTLEPCTVDGEQPQVRCPMGQVSRSWHHKTLASGGEASRVRCAMADWGVGQSRAVGTRSQKRPRVLPLPPQEQ